MFSIKQDMNLRLNEASGLIDLVCAVEDGEVNTHVKINSAVLKASVVLALYNIVESTVSHLLSKIHDEINKNQVKYEALTREIKDLSLLFYQKHKESKKDLNSSLDVLHQTLDFVLGATVFNLPYKEMEKSYQLYSGNLDAKKIRNVMKKYGIVIRDDLGKSLKSIKDGRNTLAHGDKSFEEYGRDVVSNALRVYHQDVSIFLREVISEVEVFFLNKKYTVCSYTKKKQRPPAFTRRAMARSSLGSGRSLRRRRLLP